MKNAPINYISIAEHAAIIAELTARLDSLQKELDKLKEENAALKLEIKVYKTQLFGSKSEKTLDAPFAQNDLFPEALPPALPPAKEKPEYTHRGKAKKTRPHDCVTANGLRFSSDVPVKVERITPAELLGENAEDYEIISTDISYKLAQNPSSYYVIQYEIPVLKHKPSQVIIPTAKPDQVFDGCSVHITLLVGLIIEKFLYHMPLYRQHQRMQQNGIFVSRASLTQWVKRVIELLRPIVDAQLLSVLQSKVLAMDETPIKAGKPEKGAMKNGWLWPLFGDKNEVVFTYNKSRGRGHIDALLLDKFKGTLLTDGYAAYSRFVEHCEDVIHAQCWVHARRKFYESRECDESAVDHALNLIAKLYAIEASIKTAKMAGETKFNYRQQHSAPLVEEFFAWCEQQNARADLTPKNKFKQALAYALSRQAEMRVFLFNPDVAMDTNHLEREIRPITLGRKNWLFCWTDLGAEHLAIIQSLLATLKLHKINPVVYLTDVLQRVSTHPASQVADLTPRMWKERFGDCSLGA